MMVVSAGASDAITQLKAILELAQDPKKLLKAIGDLEQVSIETKKLLDEKAAVEASAEAKLKQLAIDGPKFEAQLAAVKQADEEISAKHVIYAANLNDLENREQWLATGRKELEKGKAELLADIQKQKLANEADRAVIAKEKAENDDRQNLLEAKLAKLKQAMG